MARHYRGVLDESKIHDSPAWRETKLAIRHLNTISPLLLSLIRTHGPGQSMEERMRSLDFMTKSVDSLATVMSERLAASADGKQYDRIELTSMLSHVVGGLAETAPAEQEQERIDDLLRTVAGMYASEEFAARHGRTAKLMMDKIGYLRVECPETMEARLRMAMHQASLRLFDAVSDERLSNGRGVFFHFGLKKTELYAKLVAEFQEFIGGFLGTAIYSPSLTNDQRTSVMQSWIRQAGDLYRTEFISNTVMMIDWAKAGLKISEAEYKTRFASAKGSLDGVFERVRTNSTETLNALISTVGFDGLPPAVEPESQAAPRT